MSATVLNKYVGVSFGGKTGSLIITSEKLIFRPKLTANEKAANVKPSARSWRWAAIDRVEILDPSRGAIGTKERNLKLKPKVAGHKTATLTIPSENLANVVEDVNQRLSSSALGVEGILPSKKKNAVAPVLPKNPVRSPVGKRVSYRDNSVQNTQEPQKTVATMNSKPEEPINPKEKAMARETQPQMTRKTDVSEAATKQSPQKSSILATPPQPPKPNAVSNTTRGTSWTPSADLVYTPPPAVKDKAEETINPKEKAAASEIQPQTTQKSDASEAGIKESPQNSSVLAIPLQPPKPKAVSNTTRATSWAPSADLVYTPPTVDKPNAVSNNTRGTSWTPSADMAFTPPTVKKDKVAQDNFATPTTGNTKEKAEREIIFTPPQPSPKHIDIEFTPTQKDKAKIDALNMSFNNKEGEEEDKGGEEEDDTSVSTRSSDLTPDNYDDQQQQIPQEPTKSIPHPPLAGQLFNPNSPEHRFRMMIFQHAATCGWEKGTCQYDPICSQQKDILAHIATCTAEEECTVDKCRATKQFLLTMRLMTQMQQEGSNDAGANKDFLVGVGAVAPIPVIELPNSKMGCSNHSVVSESTWWSNDWGGVEDDDGDDSD